MTSNDSPPLPFEPPGEGRKYSIWLRPWVRKRISRNQDLLCLVVGPRGSGKSYSALELAHSFDGTFTVDRVFFSVADFVDLLVNGNLQRGQAVILDDAGLFMNSRSWREIGNQLMSIVSQSFRYRGLLTFITVPQADFIDRQSRNMANLLMEATKEQGTFKIKVPEQNPFKPGEYVFKYPRVGILNQARRTVYQPLKTIHLDMPPSDLVADYENKRQTFVRGIQRAFLEKVRKAEGGEKSEDKGKSEAPKKRGRPRKK